MRSITMTCSFNFKDKLKNSLLNLSIADFFIRVLWQSEQKSVKYTGKENLSGSIINFINFYNND